MERRAMNDRILILGIDGMDPRATKHYLEEGKLPNIKKMLERGAANEKLEMIGGHPTGTPPMWTTLATGAYSNVHGITCFKLPSNEGLEYTEYAFDSRRCKAEQLWNVFAENDMKTLVFHWPGSSWPPSSECENLHVIDGTQPTGINAGVGIISGGFMARASRKYEKLLFKPKGDVTGYAPCALSDLDEDIKNPEDEHPLMQKISKVVMLNKEEGTDGFALNAKYDYSDSPIKDATGWINAPEDALEFTILMSGGLVRRPALMVKNEGGKYDTVLVYKSKKDEIPFVTLKKNGPMIHDIIDVDFRGNNKFDTVKSMRILEMEDDGSYVRIYVSGAMKINENRFFSPSRLYQEIAEYAGHPCETPMFYGQDDKDLFDCMLPMWDHYCEWQSKAIHRLIEKENYQVVFSHLHNVDDQMHIIVRSLKDRETSRYTSIGTAEYMEKVYIQTDEYVGSFLHYIDEGWTIFLISDHGLVCPYVGRNTDFGDVNGINVGLMEKLGFTVMIKDENGNDTHEIDWSKTVAVASRANNIYINLKSKYEHGIVEDKDQYRVEEEIMTALYGYRDPKSGMRVISLALRNKDAVLLGYGGPDCGEICAWVAEGYNDDHFDGITTCYGENYTSLQPILIAAGKGIKEKCRTSRIIRQVDFAPTVAIIGGVRMPKQCEGAPIYQILQETF